MSKTHPHYLPEFRRQMVELVRVGRHPADLACEFEPSAKAIVLDAWSRKVVGWAMANHLRTALVLDVFEMAIDQRRPQGVVLHTD